MKNKTALIAGATGLIGNELLQILREGTYYQKIYVLTRRELNLSGARVAQLLLNYDTFTSADLPEVDDVYCCLGTTMKNAGSKEAFRKVDYEFPLKIAKLSRTNGAKQYILVSSMGADKNSSIFYNQVKGETENALLAVAYPALHIFRPSILLGDRKENRTGEKVAQQVMKGVAPLLKGKLKNYRPVEGQAVAKAMFVAAQQNLQGPHLFESEQIKVLAKEYQTE